MITLKPRHIKILFWLLFTISLILTLMPANKVPDVLVFWDKMQHCLCFAVLTFFGIFAYQRLMLVCAGLTIYGAAIELMQTYFTTSRNGDWLDWVADCIGILAGMGLFLMIKKYVRI